MAPNILTREQAVEDPELAAIFDQAKNVEMARANIDGYNNKIVEFENELAATPTGTLLAAAREEATKTKAQLKQEEDALRTLSIAFFEKTGKAPFGGVEIARPANLVIDEDALMAWLRQNSVHALDEGLVVPAMGKLREYASRRGIALSGKNETDLRARAEQALPWVRDVRTTVCTIKKTISSFLAG